MSCKSINTVLKSGEYIKSIQLPRKNPIRSLSIACETNHTPQYGLYLNSPQFDPNMENSPPNLFMQNLQERMNIYHNSSNYENLST